MVGTAALHLVVFELAHWDGDMLFFVKTCSDF